MSPMASTQVTFEDDPNPESVRWDNEWLVYLSTEAARPSASSAPTSATSSSRANSLARRLATGCRSSLTTEQPGCFRPGIPRPLAPNSAGQTGVDPAATAAAWSARRDARRRERRRPQRDGGARERCGLCLHAGGYPGGMSGMTSSL